MNEEPSDYLKEMIETTNKQKERGETSPIFDNAEDALAWLNK